MKTLAVVAILLMLLAACARHIPVPPTVTPHNSGRTVTVSWTASTTAGVTYNVYRATSTCASATTGTKLSTVDALTYNDVDVPVGTLCYWATSFLQSAATQESVPSNKAEVTIIQTPNPPSNLQVSPTAVTMRTGTTQLFRSNLSGTVWSLDPPVGSGTISNTGLYTAPQRIQGNNVQVDVIGRNGTQAVTSTVILRKN